MKERVLKFLIIFFFFHSHPVFFFLSIFMLNLCWARLFFSILFYVYVRFIKMRWQFSVCEKAFNALLYIHRWHNLIFIQGTMLCCRQCYSRAKPFRKLMKNFFLKKIFNKELFWMCNCIHNTSTGKKCKLK